MGNKISISERQYTLHEDNTINIDNKDNSAASLYAKYHRSEIEQNKIIIENSVKMIWIGIFLLFIGMVFSLFLKNNFIMLAPGAFIDIFSGAMVYLVNKSSETKEKYFKNISIVEQQQRVLDLINSSDNAEFREKMIEKFIDKTMN